MQDMYLARTRELEKDLEEKLKKQQEAMEALGKRIAFRLGEAPEKGRKA
jgi:hypothetical protein